MGEVGVGGMHGIQYVLYGLATILVGWFSPRIIVSSKWPQQNRVAFSILLTFAMFIAAGVYRLTTGEDIIDNIQEVVFCPIFSFSHCPNHRSPVPTNTPGPTVLRSAPPTGSSGQTNSRPSQSYPEQTTARSDGSLPPRGRLVERPNTPNIEPTAQPRQPTESSLRQLPSENSAALIRARNAGLNAATVSWILLSVESTDHNDVGLALAKRLTQALSGAGFQIATTNRDAALRVRVAITNINEPTVDLTTGVVAWVTTATVQVTAVWAADGTVLFSQSFSGQGGGSSRDASKLAAIRNTVDPALDRFKIMIAQ